VRVAGAQPSKEAGSPSALVEGGRPTNYAITIDGVPATQEELKALPKDVGVSYTMWVKSATGRSSDPRAVNGLLEVTTKRAAKKK
jgi:hypothetical protein